MNPPHRRLARLLTGCLATGLVTASLLAPTTAAYAGPVPSAECAVVLAELDTALADLQASRVEHRAAKAALKKARARYERRPTRERRRALRAARALELQTRAARVAAVEDYLLAESAAVPCQPAVSVTNPRVAFYGSDFGIADITWSNVPYDEYRLFMRYDDAPAVPQGAVTFVEVLPPFVPLDPFNPAPVVNYLQNDVTYTGSYLGGGCDYTPGQDVTVELWTDATDTHAPAGTLVASSTVDNPCR